MATLRQYYNSKYPKAPITYDGRYVLSGGKQIRYQMDVRDFIFNDNVIIKNLVQQIVRGSKTEEQKVLKILFWVQQHITYVPDKENEGVDEFWQFPVETLTLRKGDCEDGSILIASMLLNAGIPAYRVRIAAGLVKAGKAAETGGHAWCTYTMGTEAEAAKTVALDWCYYANKLNFAQRPNLSEDNNYIEIWFSWNHQYSWARQPLEVGKSIKLSASTPIKEG